MKNAGGIENETGKLRSFCNPLDIHDSSPNATGLKSESRIGQEEDDPISLKAGSNLVVSRNRSKAYYWSIAGITISVILFAFVSLMKDGQQVYYYIFQVSPALLAALLSLSLANYILRSLRWHVFSCTIKLKVPFLVNGLYYFAGFSMAITPGKMGEMLRLWLLRRSHHVSYERTVGLLIADRLSDAGAMLLILAIGAFAFAPGFGQIISAAVIGIVITGMTMAFLRPLGLIGVTDWVYGRVRRWPKQFARARRVLRQISQLGSISIYGGTFMMAFLGWVAEAYGLHLLVTAFGGSQSLMEIMFVFSSALLVGIVAMLPGGLGGTEISMVGLLAATGLDIEAAIAATAIIRLTTLWFSVFLGMLSLPAALWVASGSAFRRSSDKTMPDA